MGSVIFRRDGQVVTLELSNPGKANALDSAMLGDLERHVAAIEEDRSIRAVALRGRPASTFSSGADIAEWGAMSPEVFARDWIGRGNAIFRRFEGLRCPTVAVIEGLCYGGGLELALCADLRVATAGARFRFPEVAIGALPGWEGGPRLDRIVGRGRALEAVLLANEISAETAQDWGLVNVLLPATALDATMQSLFDRLCTVSPRAAALAKASVVGREDPDIFFPAAAATLKASTDSAIGIRAFAAKTSAVF